MNTIGKDLKSRKVKIIGILVPVPYALLIFIGIITLYSVGFWINQDRQQTLISDSYGFSINYPANWKLRTFGERGSKNLHDLKATISNLWLGFLPSSPKDALWVHWLSAEDMTLTQTAAWGFEKFEQRNGSVSELKEIRIGVGEYPALTRTFQYASSSKVRIHYYVISDQGAIILEFYAKSYDTETEAVFNQMLSTFRIID